MKNPLHKRIPREIRSEWKKYVVLFLLLTLTIGFVSGMFVANDSMETAALEAYDKYSIEDGHFELKDKATDELLDQFEDEGITVYEQFYKDFDEDFDQDGMRDAKIRVFINRDTINRICLMEGAFPSQKGEIAIDRMHADNQNIQVGDIILLSGTPMKVCGLVAFADYSTLYEDNSDMMFDALTFNIGAVTREGYEALTGKQIWQYAFTYNKKPADAGEQKEVSDDLVKKLAILAATGGMTDDEDTADKLRDDIDAWTAVIENVQTKADELTAMQTELESKSPEKQLAAMQELKEKADELEELAEDAKKAGDELKALEKYEDHINEITDFVPEYANHAIHFAPEDMGSDKVMGEYLLLILVAVLAFIFAITASNTITQEAAVIGTLRSLGYTQGELLRHYITMPVTVTLLAAIIGNVLGYSVFKNVVVAMYYNSYSLPTYVTLWNADAFIKTTLWPVILMLVVNIWVVYAKLRISPLKFLRHDLGSSKRKKALRLPAWGFLKRFRLRVLFQNLGNYIVLFAGIFFVMILLSFAVGLPATLNNYQANAADYMIADYQYLLKSYKDEDGNFIETKQSGAEKYGAASLETTDGVHIGEEVAIYGYVDDSKYFDLDTDLARDEVFISSAFAGKFGLSGDEMLTLKEKYASDTYTFHIKGIYDYPGSVAVFMPIENLNQTFDRDAGSFSGFLSEEKITDIDPDDIMITVTIDDITKIAKQLDHSMGDYMTYFSVICVLVAMLIIYLLTKLIIEKNMVSISMLKVLGYENREISRLYIRMTTLVVILSAIITSFLGEALIVVIWRYIMYDLNGWFEFYLKPTDLMTMILLVLIAYVIVACVDMHRIRRIPMTEALKNVE